MCYVNIQKQLKGNKKSKKIFLIRRNCHLKCNASITVAKTDNKTKIKLKYN